VRILNSGDVDVDVGLGGWSGPKGAGDDGGEDPAPCPSSFEVFAAEQEKEGAPVSSRLSVL
jgi:hypothetical protein